MRYLLDTHTLLWFLFDDKQLSTQVIEDMTLITKDGNIVKYNVKTLW